MKTATGEFWHGDCLDLMRHIPDASVDMILCDLPYGTTQNKWDSVVNLNDLWDQYWRVVKPNSPILLTAQTPFDKILGSSQINNLKYEWIWEKNNSTGFMNAKKMPLKSHENVLCFYKNLPTYNPIMTKGDRIKVVGGQASHGPNYNKKTNNRGNYDSDQRYPRSVQYFAKDNKFEAIHPTQKPVALFDYLIRTYTNPGDLVLDNCAGSGTTAVAAHAAGRRWLCIERDLGYYLGACGRVWAAQQ